MSIYLFPIRRPVAGVKTRQNGVRVCVIAIRHPVKLESDQAAQGVEIGSVGIFSLVACCCQQAGPFEDCRVPDNVGHNVKLARILAYSPTMWFSPPSWNSLIAELPVLERDINQIPCTRRKTGKLEREPRVALPVLLPAEARLVASNCLCARGAAGWRIAAMFLSTKLASERANALSELARTDADFI